MTTECPPTNDRKEQVPCRHCGRMRTGNRPRGLCWTCYYTPSVRDLYPADARFAGQAGRATDNRPAAACQYAPGSDAKIAVMGRRADSRLDLHHPDDRNLF